jgi:isopentenyldiphosphate isomerase
MYNDTMDEEVLVSPIKNVFENRSYSRKKFYDEKFNGVDNGLAVHVTDALLFGLDGEIILQKRASDKRHNPGLIDKTLGGHIKYGDTADYTVMVETIQELLTPSIVLDSDDDFDKTLDLLKNYIDTIAIVSVKTVRAWSLEKLVGDQKIVVNNIVHLYFGVYGGRMRPADKEAAGVLYYSDLEQLEKEINTHPDIFTDDLIQIIKEYRDDILAFQSKIREKLIKQ